CRDDAGDDIDEESGEERDHASRPVRPGAEDHLADAGSDEEGRQRQLDAGGCGVEVRGHDREGRQIEVGAQRWCWRQHTEGDEYRVGDAVLAFGHVSPFRVEGVRRSDRSAETNNYLYKYK